MGTNSDSSKSSSKMKKDWYQTDSHVIITIFIKGVQSEDLNISFQERSVTVEIKSATNSDLLATFDLWHYIRPDDCSYKIFSTKIEIKLKKKDGFRWESLEGDGADLEVKQITAASGGTSSCPLPNYPSSSLKKHDWNKLEAEVKREEETEKPEGDAALNQLFQKLYSDGDEEVKRAMNKSFMESGGTVLSTNWKEVGTKRVDIQAPDGMEYKKWEQ